jgi:hypothetical protein
MDSCPLCGAPVEELEDGFACTSCYWERRAAPAEQAPNPFAAPEAAAPEEEPLASPVALLLGWLATPPIVALPYVIAWNSGLMDTLQGTAATTALVALYFITAATWRLQQRRALARERRYEERGQGVWSAMQRMERSGLEVNALTVLVPGRIVAWTLRETWRALQAMLRT